MIRKSAVWARIVRDGMFVAGMTVFYILDEGRGVWAAAAHGLLTGVIFESLWTVTDLVRAKVRRRDTDDRRRS